MDKDRKEQIVRVEFSNPGSVEFKGKCVIDKVSKKISVAPKDCKSFLKSFEKAYAVQHNEFNS